MDKQIIDELFCGDSRREPRGLETVLMASPMFAAIWNVNNEFAGRDRRRIKREVRKAIAKCNREHPPVVGGIERSPNAFWRTRQWAEA